MAVLPALRRQRSYPRLRVEQFRRRPAPRAAHSGFRVRDQVIQIDASRLHQRQEPELDCGGIAPWVCDNARLAHGVPVHLAQAVRRLSHEFRAGVSGLVPFFPLSHVAYAKVGRQVDDAHAAIHQRARLAHRHRVRRGEEHHVAALQARARRIGKRKRYAAAQAGEHRVDRGPRFLARGNGGQLHLRVLRQQAQQFHPGVAGAADNARLDHARPFRPKTKEPPAGGSCCYL